jgi:hypothetical protein
MIDDPTRRVRKLCDGEELVDYDPQLPALLVTPGNPSLANAERRLRALRERAPEEPRRVRRPAQPSLAPPPR